MRWLYRRSTTHAQQPAPRTIAPPPEAFAFLRQHKPHDRNLGDWISTVFDFDQFLIRSRNQRVVIVGRLGANSPDFDIGNKPK